MKKLVLTLIFTLALVLSFNLKSIIVSANDTQEEPPKSELAENLEDKLAYFFTALGGTGTMLALAGLTIRRRCKRVDASIMNLNSAESSYKTLMSNLISCDKHTLETATKVGDLIEKIGVLLEEAQNSYYKNEEKINELIDYNSFLKDIVKIVCLNDNGMVKKGIAEQVGKVIKSYEEKTKETQKNKTQL